MFRNLSYNFDHVLETKWWNSSLIEWHNKVPSEDHLGSVGDSTSSGSQPATHTRLSILLQSRSCTTVMTWDWNEEKFHFWSKAARKENLQGVILQLILNSPILRKVSNPELWFIPWHVRVMPLNPCNLFPFRIHSRKSIEVTSFYQHLWFWELC